MHTRSNPGRAPRSHPTQVVIHRWGWTLILHPDGTTTAWKAPDARHLYPHGWVRHVFAIYELGEDKARRDIKPCKTRARFLEFCRP